MTIIKYLAYYDTISKRIVKVVSESTQHIYISQSSDYIPKPEHDEERNQYIYDEE